MNNYRCSIHNTADFQSRQYLNQPAQPQNGILNVAYIDFIPSWQRNNICADQYADVQAELPKCMGIFSCWVIFHVFFVVC